MTRLFKRGARVTVWEPKPSEFFADPNATNAVEIEQLRVTFNIVRTLKREPDTCELTITNGNADTRGLFTKKPVCARLEAGYDGDLRTLFIGDLIYASSRLEGADWTTTAQLGDGMRAFANARLAQTFEAGVTVLEALENVAGKMGFTLPANVRRDPEMRAQFAAGLSLAGAAQEQMQRMLAPFGYTWSVQHGQLVILKSAEAAPGSAIVVDVDSGLIGSPETGAPSKDQKIPITTFKTLLNEQLLPGRLVELTARGFNRAVLKVIKTTLAGDTHGGDFATTCEALPL